MHEIELGGEYERAFVEVNGTTVIITFAGTNGTNIISIIPFEQIGGTK